MLSSKVNSLVAGIYPLLRLNHCNSFSYSCAILVEGREKRRQRSQKIHNLPILATCWSGTLVKVNSLIAHERTWQWLIWLILAWCSTICHDNQHRSSAIVGDSQRANYMHAFQNLSAHKSATSDTILKLVECLWSTWCLIHSSFSYWEVCWELENRQLRLRMVQPWPDQPNGFWHLWNYIY